MTDESKWPTLRLTGGPSGVEVKALLDGEEIKRTSRIVIDAGVGDAVRIITYQFAELDIEVEGTVESHGLVYEASALLYEPDELGSRLRIPKERIAVTADTPWDALRDIATQMELAAAQGVAPAGTV